MTANYPKAVNKGINTAGKIVAGSLADPEKGLAVNTAEGGTVHHGNTTRVRVERPLPCGEKGPAASRWASKQG